VYSEEFVVVSYDLNSWSFLLLVVEVFFAFVASFLSIFLWAKTRRAGEIFLVMGILSMFVKLVYRVLLTFGFFSINSSFLKNTPLILFILSLLPYVFFIFALIFFIKER